ncbi:MAG: GYDIA family GHMP kinase [Bacteroidota bacterium]|nr:GYDIA family GHMP kinase [Bacteroidota bacterium]
MMQEFYSHGKLLISAEYAILDGAKALALPTKLGQSLQVTKTNTEYILWKSFDYQNKLWFETTLSTTDFKPSTANPTSERLSQCFQAVHELQPKLFESQKGLEFISHMEFPQNWGLGSSSTLINNLAQWAKVDAFELLEKTFGGSGYDVGCAQHSKPILYQRQNNKPHIEIVDFDPPFKDQLFFVHRNQKQNSREAIAAYEALKKGEKLDFSELNAITNALSKTSTLEAFESLIIQHEILISELIQHPPLKTTHFTDYPGAIKSLGAWGGDFFLATGSDFYYFKDKGFSRIVAFENMVL